MYKTIVVFYDYSKVRSKRFRIREIIAVKYNPAYRPRCNIFECFKGMNCFKHQSFSSRQSWIDTAVKKGGECFSYIQFQNCSYSSISMNKIHIQISHYIFFQISPQIKISSGHLQAIQFVNNAGPTIFKIVSYGQDTFNLNTIQ